MMCFFKPTIKCKQYIFVLLLFINYCPNHHCCHFRYLLPYIIMCQNLLLTCLTCLSFDIETGIKTFESWVLQSRLELRLSDFESWYQDWNWDFKDHNLKIKTGIKTKRFEGIPVIETLARVTVHLCVCLFVPSFWP